MPRALRTFAILPPGTRIGKTADVKPDGAAWAAPAGVIDQGWFARIEWTSAPSVIVVLRKLMTSSPAIVSRPM